MTHAYEAVIGEPQFAFLDRSLWDRYTYKARRRAKKSMKEKVKSLWQFAKKTIQTIQPMLWI